jgi:hypothetical protein
MASKLERQHLLRVRIELREAVARSRQGTRDAHALLVKLRGTKQRLESAYRQLVQDGQTPSSDAEPAGCDEADQGYAEPFTGSVDSP